MTEVKKHIKDSPWFISHDNFNTPFRVFSQRTDNQGEFANGTAATVYVKPNVPRLPKGLGQLLKQRRAEGQQQTLTELEVFDLAQNSYPVIQHHIIYQVLQFLIESPEFDLKTYSRRDHELLKPPPPVDQLPVGPEHATLQYLLGSVGIPEASYEDNARLINEWLGQLGISTDDARKKLSDEEFVVWVGDQLTVDRLRGLFKFRAEDENSFDRLDFVVLAFGWFHLQMAWATSIHKQYLGTSQSRGLKQAFLLLEKKGLTKPLIKGPFHHDLEEALFHISEAQIRVDWLEEGNVEQLADLRKYTPQQLYKLAEKIVKNRASSEAIDSIDAQPEEQRDDEFRQVAMWNRDMLQYIVLARAIQNGDVGLMEAMLPHLLFRFLGGGNSKYANEVIELLQGLHKEWPKDVS